MSWLKIDDAFEDHPKVEPLSDAAHRLWMRAATWCKKPANQHTNGFVPRALLATIARRSAPASKLLKLAQELVDARGGGTFEQGLWEMVDDGWLFHDWATYQHAEKPAPLTRSEAARVAGQRSAQVRRATLGTAQPRSPERLPNVAESFGDVRPNDVRRTNVERPEPPYPLPYPLPKPTDGDPKDLTGRDAPVGDASTHAPEDPQANWDGSERETMCPTDLVQRAIAVGVPKAVAQALGVDESQVLDSLREFTGYWTIGGGANQTRRHWMRKAREHVRKSAEQNKLKPPGAVEHELRVVEPALSAEYLAGVTARLAKSREQKAREQEVGHG